MKTFHVSRVVEAADLYYGIPTSKLINGRISKHLNNHPIVE